VARANAQDLEGAAAILEKLVADVKDGDLRGQAGDLLRRVRKAMGG
jgi:hypothetical protein